MRTLLGRAAADVEFRDRLIQLGHLIDQDPDPARPSSGYLELQRKLLRLADEAGLLSGRLDQARANEIFGWLRDHGQELAFHAQAMEKWIPGRSYEKPIGRVFLSWTLSDLLSRSAMLVVRQTLDFFNVEYFDFTQEQIDDFGDASQEIIRQLEREVARTAVSIEVHSSNVGSRWIQHERSLLRDRAAVHRIFLCVDAERLFQRSDHEERVTRVDVSAGRFSTVTLPENETRPPAAAWLAYYGSGEFFAKCFAVAWDVRRCLERGSFAPSALRSMPGTRRRRDWREFSERMANGANGWLVGATYPLRIGTSLLRDRRWRRSFNAGIDAYRRGWLEESRANFESAANLAVDRRLEPRKLADSVFHRGVVRLLLGRRAEADADFSEVREIGAASHPGAVQAAEMLAFEREQGREHPRLARERQYLACAVAQTLPGSVSILNNLGVSLRRAGQTKWAIAVLQCAVQRSFADGSLHSNLGNALRQDGRIEDAITAFQYSLVLSPGNPIAMVNLGCALWRNGELDEAIDVLEKAKRLRPGHPGTLTNLGIALLKRGHVDRARSAFAELDELDADHPLPRLMRGDATGARERVAVVAAWMSRADCAELRDDLEVLRAAGFEGAEECLRALAPAFPPDPGGFMSAEALRGFIAEFLRGAAGSAARS